MKKIIFSTLSFLAAAGIASAQVNTTSTSTTQKTVESENSGNTTTTVVVEKTVTSTETEDSNTILVNDFTKNWEFSFGLGAQAYVGEYAGTHQKFADFIAGPAIDLSIQKWTTPFFAFGIGLNFSPYKGLYMASDTKATFRQDSDPLYTDKHGNQNTYLAGSKLNRWYGDFFVQVALDFNNLCGGYRADRMYHCIGYIGGGVALALNSSVYTAVAPSFNAGLINQFNINNNWAINVNLRGALYGDVLNGIAFYTSEDAANVPLDGMIGLTAGFSYKFGFVSKKSVLTGAETTAAWIPMTTAILASQEYADAVHDTEAAATVAKEFEAKVAETESKLADAEQKIEQQKSEIKSIQNKPYRQFVNFVIDQWKVSNREKVSIMIAAEVMKSCPDVKFKVNGYADKQTATPKHNKMLSENRAEAVRKILVEELGVPAEQLVVNDFGGVDTMFFDDPQCSRSVIIEAVVD